jgi:Thymidylate synthase complementing protein
MPDDNVTNIGRGQAIGHPSPPRVGQGEEIVPVVTLISMPADPLGSLAAIHLMNAGYVIHDTIEIIDTQRMAAWQTGGYSVLSAVQLHLLLENITIRLVQELYRLPGVSVFEENLDYAIAENIDEDVLLPPTLRSQPGAKMWQQAVNKIDDAYHMLLASGALPEHASGLLPRALVTRAHLRIGLDSLIFNVIQKHSWEMHLVMQHVSRALRAVSFQATNRVVEGRRDKVSDMDGCGKVWMSSVISDKIDELLGE